MPLCSPRRLPRGLRSPRSRRRVPRALALLATTATVATAGLAAAPASQAATDSWNCWLSSAGWCNYDRHSLIAVTAYSPAGRTVAAGGSFYGNSSSMHGSWIVGGGYACRIFSGANVLYPMLKNGSSVSSTVYGWSSWGSGASSC